MVNPSSGPPGTSVTVGGSGFHSTSPGSVRWDDGTLLGSFFFTNANGAFSVQVNIPDNATSGDHTITACSKPSLIIAPICASAPFRVELPPTPIPTLTPIPRPTLTPSPTPTPTPEPTVCDQTGAPGEIVIDFENFTEYEDLRGVTLPEGVRFIGDGGMMVISPSVATHSGSKALSMRYVGEFGSGGVPMRIGFTNLQDFVGLYVGLNERIGSNSPITATLTAYALDEGGNSIVAGTDSVSFGPDATPIKECLSVAASRIFEVIVNYGSVGEPEVIDDLLLRGPATPVPVPADDKPPRITILQPEMGLTVTEPYVRLQGEVREDRELASLNYQLSPGVFHEIVFTPAGVTPEGDRLYLFVVNPLPPGELTACGDNTVQMQAFDTSGNMGAAETTFRLLVGDLSIRSVEAVQVVYGAPLVKGKGTAFQVKLDSTFACPVDAEFKLELPDGQWRSGVPTAPGGTPFAFPEVWGPTSVPAMASEYVVMLPLVLNPNSIFDPTTNPTGLGGVLVNADPLNADPQLRVVPQPITDLVSFAVEIDPNRRLAETNETNNRFESLSYQVVTTRPYSFVGYRTSEGKNENELCTPTTVEQATSAFRAGLEYILGVYPIADAKISGRLSSFEQTYDYSVENRGVFLTRVAALSKTYGYDFGVALGCGDAGAAGVDAVVISATDWREELLAHEFNHVIVPMGDVYSLDCYCCWDEWYCQLPDGDGDRFYCCYDQNPGGTIDYDTERANKEAAGVDPMQGCTVSCGQDETYDQSDDGTPDCDGACCRTRCENACSAQRGTVYGCPDRRPGTERILLASDGFWVNRWVNKEGKTYFMDGPLGDNWMILESTKELGQPSCPGTYGTDINGYLDLLESARFQSAADPAALLVSGSVHKDGTAEFWPFAVLPDAFLDLAPGAAGDYIFVLYDDAGRVLTQTGFRLLFWLPDPGGGPVDEAYFVYRIEWKEGVARIELKDRDGQVLARRDVSPSKPTVDILEPNGGTVLAGKAVEVRWRGNDPDGDPLVYSLGVSDDEGKTWQPAALHITGSSYELDASGFVEGKGYLVKVIVTDGVNTSEDISDSVFSVRRLDLLLTPGLSQEFFVLLLAMGFAVAFVISVGLIVWGLLETRRARTR